MQWFQNRLTWNLTDRKYFSSCDEIHFKPRPINRASNYIMMKLDARNIGCQVCDCHDYLNYAMSRLLARLICESESPDFYLIHSSGNLGVTSPDGTNQGDSIQIEVISLYTNYVSEIWMWAHYLIFYAPSTFSICLRKKFQQCLEMILRVHRTYLGYN